MATIRITIEGELSEMTKFTTGFFNEELWEPMAANVPKELILYPPVEGTDVRVECKYQTLTGMEKKGSNWEVTFIEYPKKWTLPCLDDGRGNRKLAEDIAQFFIDDLDEELSHSEHVVFKHPVRCHIDMECSERGKFKDEWIWNRITRS